MFVVRQAQKRDLKEIIDLRLKLVKSYPASYLVTFEESREQTPEDWKKWLMKYLAQDQSNLFVAQEGKKPIGMVACRREILERLEHTGTVVSLGVLPDYRGRGTGEALMVRLINWAKLKGKIRRLQLEVFSDNQEAVALYQKLGFKKEGVKKKYARRKDGRYQDALLMVLFL